MRCSQRPRRHERNALLLCVFCASSEFQVVLRSLRLPPQRPRSMWKMGRSQRSQRTHHHKSFALFFNHHLPLRSLFILCALCGCHRRGRGACGRWAVRRDRREHIITRASPFSLIIIYLCALSSFSARSAVALCVLCEIQFFPSLCALCGCTFVSLIFLCVLCGYPLRSLRLHSAYSAVATIESPQPSSARTPE